MHILGGGIQSSLSGTGAAGDQRGERAEGERGEVNNRHPCFSHCKSKIKNEHFFVGFIEIVAG